MRVFVTLSVSLLFSSCVSTRVYEQLKTKFDTITRERNDLADSLQTLQSSNKQLENKHKMLRRNYDKTTTERDQLEQNNVALEKQIESLKTSYKLLEENRNSEIVRNSRKNRNLLDSLEKKQHFLGEKMKALSRAQSQSYKLSKNIDSLEETIEKYLKEIDTLEINQQRFFQVVDSLSTALDECSDREKQLLESQKTK